MKKRITATLVTMCMTAAMLAGCAGAVTTEQPVQTAATEAKAPDTQAAAGKTEAETGDTQAEKKQMVVAFSQMEMNNAWRVAETNSIKAEAEARGVKLIYTDANGDTAKQVSDV